MTELVIKLIQNDLHIDRAKNWHHVNSWTMQKITVCQNSPVNPAYLYQGLALCTKPQNPIPSRFVSALESSLSKCEHFILARQWKINERL